MDELTRVMLEQVAMGRRVWFHEGAHNDIVVTVESNVCNSGYATFVDKEKLEASKDSAQMLKRALRESAVAIDSKEIEKLRANKT